MELFTGTVDDINPALPQGPETMGIMVYSLLWVMQDLYHQPYLASLWVKRSQTLNDPASRPLAGLRLVLQFCKSYHNTMPAF